jgi:predicted heme/steroid binding protein
MTREELATHDGRDGRAAYVAVSGTIYDVSASDYWKEGTHLDTHQAGQELTVELRSAPHVRSVIERFPVVGKLEEKNAVTNKKPGLSPLSIAIIALVTLLLVVTYIVAL